MFKVLWPVSRNSLGKEFHRFGPSTENARRPHEFRRHDELMTIGGA